MAILRKQFGKRIRDDQWEKIRQSVSEENHRNILVTCLAFMAMLATMLLLSPLSLKLALSKPLYVTMIGCSLAIYAIARHVKPGDWKVVRPLMYVLISLLLVYATILGTVFSSGQIATAFPAFVLASPLLFTDRKNFISIFIIVHTTFFVLMAVVFDDTTIIADDIINSCIFSVASVVINSYLIGVKLRDKHAQLQLAELGRKDLLTGVKSRNAYEQELLGYPDRCKLSLSCVFVDLNGLHELNDHVGHSNGDEALRCVSTALKAAFGEDDVYRIGGDEFVVLVCDIDERELNLKVEFARLETERQSCHVSIGTARAQAPVSDVNELVRRAELGMYSDKRRYYEREGIDRRRRRD